VTVTEQQTATEHDQQQPPGTGGQTITVRTNESAAQFTISGPATYSGSGTEFVQANAPTGTYTIIYDPVSGFLKPADETKSLSEKSLCRLPVAKWPIDIGGFKALEHQVHRTYPYHRLA